MNASDRRFTLPSTLAAIKEVFGVEEFDLDPCADVMSCCARNWFTDSGLDQRWHGRIYVNPPFSDIAPWVDKALHELPRVKSVTFLLPANRTNQSWWIHLWQYARGTGQLNDAIHWLSPRVKFGTPEDPGGKRKNNHPPFACVAVHLRGGK